MKSSTMKGVSIVRDIATQEEFLQIPIDLVDKKREEVEDMLDAIVADRRRNEPTISLAELKKRLKKAGKL
jgi:hypothetical protein